MIKKKLSKAQQEKFRNIRVKFEGGQLSEVINTKGKKPTVYIFQGMKPGFSARYVKSHRNIKGSSRNAEKYAWKLALAGHKRVIFRD